MDFSSVAASLLGGVGGAADVAQDYYTTEAKNKQLSDMMTKYPDAFPRDKTLAAFLKSISGKHGAETLKMLKNMPNLPNEVKKYLVGMTMPSGGVTSNSRGTIPTAPTTPTF
jgi:hypothetical protein